MNVAKSWTASHQVTVSGKKADAQAAQVWLLAAQTSPWAHSVQLPPPVPQCAQVSPAWHVSPAQQSAHGAQTPALQLWQAGQLSTHCPPLQHWAPGHGFAPSQAVQTWLTQIGVGFSQPPQLTFCPQLFSTVPQTPAVQGSAGVQPQTPGVPGLPPPHVSGRVQLTQAAPPVPHVALLSPCSQVVPAQHPLPPQGSEQVPSPWQVSQAAH